MASSSTLVPEDFQALELWATEMKDNGCMSRAALLCRVIQYLERGNQIEPVTPTITLASREANEHEPPNRTRTEHTPTPLTSPDSHKTHSTGILSRTFQASKSMISSLTSFSSSSIGLPKAFDSGHSWTLQAHPGSIHIPRCMLIESPIGRCLERWHCLEFVWCSCLLLLIFFLMYAPGSQPMRTDDGLEIDRYGTVAWMGAIVSAMLLWFVAAHRLNRLLFFNAMCSFDCLVIFASFTCGEAVIIWVMCNHYVDSGGFYDLEWRVFDILGRVFVTLPSGIVLGTIDSWRMTRKCKATMLSLIIIYLVYYVYWHRFLTNMWPPKTCMWSYCENPRQIFVATRFQVLLFVLKSGFAYLTGNPVAFIYPRFINYQNKTSLEDSRTVDATRSAGDAPTIIVSTFTTPPTLEGTKVDEDGAMCSSSLLPATRKDCTDDLEGETKSPTNNPMAAGAERSAFVDGNPQVNIASVSDPHMRKFSL